MPSTKLDKATEKNISRLDALADHWIDSFRDKLDAANWMRQRAVPK